jgi:outer membrane usher protein
LAIPLGRRVSSAISAQHASGDSRSTQEFALQAQQNPAPGDGFGWQVRTTSQGAQQAGAVLDRHDGTYRVDLARSASQDLSVRAVASGGLALIGGSLQRGSRINDSFALVQLPDYPSVRVYADNQPVGRTDAQGNAFIPRLRSYEVNRIGVNQLDLPLDAKVDAVTVNATPYYRSGIVVRFPVTESKGAMIRVLFDDDLPAPVGATLVLNQQPEPFTVVMDGMAYLTGLSRKNQLELTWRSHRCRIAVLMPPSNDPLPDLGTFTCRGVPR